MVLGAGPAGLEAAWAAAQSGAQVLLVDDNPLPGGQIWRQRPGQPSPAQALAAALDALPHLRRLSGTRALAFPAPGQVLLEDAHRAWLQPYRALVLSSGARELLLPFPGWTLPGVTGAGGLQALVKAGTDVAKQRVVVGGSGPLLLAVAATLRTAGAQVPVVAEQATWSTLLATGAALWRWPSKAMQAARLATPALRPGTVVVRAFGQDRLEGVRLRQGTREWDQPCDRLACGFGLLPNTELAQARGCALTPERTVAVDALQATSVPGVWAAGECTGIGGSERARVQGRIAGYAAAGQGAQAQAAARHLPRWQAFADTVQRGFALGPAVRARADDAPVRCRCADVPLGALRGARGWVDAKLHTRCGMGPCQGRVCGAAAQALWGWAPPAPQAPVAPARIDSLLQQ
ncbi:MAG: FAD-dependent oxidoreductase [Rhodoferax sp.]